MVVNILTQNELSEKKWIAIGLFILMEFNTHIAPIPVVSCQFICHLDVRLPLLLNLIHHPKSLASTLATTFYKCGYECEEEFCCHWSSNCQGLKILMSRAC